MTHAVIVNDREPGHRSIFSAERRYSLCDASYFTIPDSAVTVTTRDPELLQCHKHRSLEAPLVKLSYFSKEIVPSSEDFAEAEAESKKAFTELQNAANPISVVADYSDTPYRDVFVSEFMLTPSQIEFVRNAAINEIAGPKREDDAFQIIKLIDKTVAPDSVRLRIMARPNASTVGQDSIVTNFTDSIYGLLQGGSSFAEVANSLNPNSNGGEVGWAREIDLIQMGSGLVQAAFNTPVGQPVKLSVPGQQLILQVEERTSPINKYKVAIINMPLLPARRLRTTSTMN